MPSARVAAGGRSTRRRARHPGHVGVLLKRLLGPEWSAHTLRHRYGTVTYSHARDLLTVQKLLGHARPETTMRYTPGYRQTR